MQKSDHLFAKVICRPFISTGIEFHTRAYMSLRRYTAATEYLQHGGVHSCRRNDVSVTRCINLRASVSKSGLKWANKRAPLLAWGDRFSASCCQSVSRQRIIFRAGGSSLCKQCATQLQDVSKTFADERYNRKTSLGEKKSCVFKKLILS